MKKIVFITLFFVSTSWAQRIQPSADLTTTTNVDDTKDSIVKPTPAQKETVNSAAKKAKANQKESTKSNSVEFLTPPEVSDEVITDPDTSTAKSKLQKKLTDESTHLFGLHADLNIPHILNYGADYWHISRWFSASLNFGGYAFSGVQKSSELPDGIDIKVANREAVVRVHPFQSSFYLALAYGNHTFEGSGTATYSQAPLLQPVTTTIKNKITANYMKPHVGWMWRADSGFTWGIDLGLLIPNGGEVTLDEGSIKNDSLYPSLSSTTQYKANRQKIIDDSEKLRTANLPYWALVRVGWLF